MDHGPARRPCCGRAVLEGEVLSELSDAPDLCRNHPFPGAYGCSDCGAQPCADCGSYGCTFTYPPGSDAPSGGKLSGSVPAADGFSLHEEP